MFTGFDSLPGHFRLTHRVPHSYKFQVNTSCAHSMNKMTRSSWTLQPHFFYFLCKSLSLVNGQMKCEALNWPPVKALFVLDCIFASV